MKQRLIHVVHEETVFYQPQTNNETMETTLTTMDEIALAILKLDTPEIPIVQQHVKNEEID